MSGIINESTTVIQVFTPSVVYLSSTTIPGQIVTVVDTTGAISSPQSVIISTVGAATAPSMFIQQRFGYITLISQDTNNWLPVNCNSFPTPSSVYYKAADIPLIEASTISASFISSVNGINRSTEVYSTASLRQRVFMSSLNINSIQRYFSTSVTDPRVTNVGNAKLYNSTNTVGTLNIRGSISTMGNVNVAGNISSKLGTIYIGGDVRTQGSIRGQRGLLTAVFGVSTTGSAIFNQGTTIASSVFISQSLSTPSLSTVFTSAYTINATSSILFGPGTHAIQYKPEYLNFSNLPATIPSITTNNITSSNALVTSNLTLQSFNGTPTTITFSTAQIQNSGGSITLSSVSGNVLNTVSQITAPQTLIKDTLYIDTLSLNDAAATRSNVVVYPPYTSTILGTTVIPISWDIGINGTLEGENRSFSTNMTIANTVHTNTMNTVTDTLTKFNISSLSIYSTLFLSSANLISLANVHVINRGGAIIGSQMKIGADIKASTIRTDLISSPTNIYFLGQSTASISTGIISSLSAQDIVTSSLSFTNGSFGTTMAYSTINPSTPWLLNSTFGMSNPPFTTEYGLGTYFNEVNFTAASDQIAYYSMINPATQSPTFLSTPYINTIVGTGINGFSGDGGPSSNAQIGRCIGQPASDTQYNLYFGANDIGWKLRKIQSTGTITTLGGNYRYFYGDGLFPTQAALGPKLAVSVVSPGTILITDCSNVRFRYVNEDPTIMTIAGSGQVGNSGNGGPALAATFRNPNMTVADNTSSIYIADTSNNVIRKYQLSTISLYAGTGIAGSTGDGGVATSAKLAEPYGVAINSSNDLYITDTSNCVIRAVNSVSGIITKYAGSYTKGFSGDGSLATSATLNYPRGLAFDPQNNLYICDTGNKRIRRIDVTTGIISTIAGNGVEGFSGTSTSAFLAALSSPTGITTDLNGNLYIADTNNNCIRFVNVQTGNIATVAGQPPRGGYLGNNTFATSALLSSPSQLAFDKASGFIYIADDGNSRIRLLNSATGIIYDYAGNGSPFSYGDNVPASNAIFGSIAAVATDKQDNIYVSDGEGNIIRKIDSITQTITGVVGTGGGGFTGDGTALLASVSSPKAMITTAQNDLLFCDTNNHRIRKYISSSRTVTTIAGTGVAGYSGDGGFASTAALNFPKSLTIDTTGNIFIGDSSNYRIRKIDATTGIITTYAGIGTSGTILTDGSAVSTPIGFVTALTTDNSNTLCFTETPTHGLWQIRSSDNTFQPISGISTASYLGDAGPISSALFNTPMGVIVDNSGNFVVCDSENYRLRRSYTFGIPQTPVYLNMYITFTNYYATSGIANIIVNGNTLATFTTSNINSTFVLTDTNVYSYPLQNSNPVLRDQTPYLEIRQSGNQGYMKLDGSIWVNAIPKQETLQALMNNDAGIVMNAGTLKFPYTINGITIQNEYNDVSTRSLTYTGSLNNASDPALKEQIQAASLPICYQSLETLRLRRYEYSPAFQSTFRTRDKKRLGFLTNEIQAVFPKSISEVPFEYAWATSTIETIDTTQIKYTHLGATQHLIQQVSTLETILEELNSVRNVLRDMATQRNVIH